MEALMNKQRHLDKKFIGEESNSLLQTFMSGALSPVQNKHPDQDALPGNNNSG